MNIYTITANPTKVNFRPQTIHEEIFQNINTILTTPLGSVSLFRSFGIATDYIDEPIQVAKAKLSSDIIERIELSEPRVVVESVDFTENQIEGQLTPRVKFRIRNEVN